MREEPQSHPRPGGVDWWRETELSPSSHQVNCLSSLLSVTNLYVPERLTPPWRVSPGVLLVGVCPRGHLGRTIRGKFLGLRLLL